MSLYRWTPAFVLCALFASACTERGNDAPDGDDEDEIAIPVEVSRPLRGDIVAVYSGTAPIEAFAEAEVIAKVSGEIREIVVEEGDEVRKGQILARLDGDRLRLELRQSAANLQKLKRDYERNVDLKEKGLISSGDFDKILYELEALEASYNLAKLELDYTQVRAPIDGVISNRYVRIGNTVAVNDRMFQVTSFDPLVAYLHVPEREYRNIAKDQLVGIDIDALAGERILATVTRVSPIVDPGTGTFKITIEIRDAGRRIKPGMFGRISIVYDQHEDVLQVPRSAIIEDDGETSIFVVEGDRAVRKSVRTGYSSGGMVEITEGLGDDARIVTVGQVGLKDDALVAVINEPGQSASDDAPTD